MWRKLWTLCHVSKQIKQTHLEYVNLIGLLISLSNFITALQNDRDIVTEQEAVKVKAYIDKIRAIKDVLKRDHMKVAFFGR